VEGLVLLFELNHVLHLLRGSADPDGLGFGGPRPLSDLAAQIVARSFGVHAAEVGGRGGCLVRNKG
jgi:hypothetical protein